MAKIINGTPLGEGKVYTARLELNIRFKKGAGLSVSTKSVQALGSGADQQTLQMMVVDGLLASHMEAICTYLSSHGQMEMLAHSMRVIEKRIKEIKERKTPPPSPVDPILN